MPLPTSLLDYGFAMFESALVPIPADAPKTLPVQKGEEPALELCYTAPGALPGRKRGRAAPCKLKLNFRKRWRLPSGKVRLSAA